MLENKLEYFKGNDDFSVNKKNIIQIVKDMRDLLFPGYFNSLNSQAPNANVFLKERVCNTLVSEIKKISPVSDTVAIFKSLEEKRYD